MNEAIVYGASDDLIEIEGSLREEFNANGDDDRNLFAFDNGVVLEVRYDDDGCWRVTPLRRPDLVDIEPAGDPDSDNYSDRATIRGGVLWVVHGGRWATV